MVFYLLVETMAIAFLETIVGVLLAILLAFLSASNIVPKPVAFVIRVILIVIRTIAAILGLVGAGGIGAPLLFAMNAYRPSEVGSILIGERAI